MVNLLSLLLTSYVVNKVHCTKHLKKTVLHTYNVNNFIIIQDNDNEKTLFRHIFAIYRIYYVLLHVNNVSNQFIYVLGACPKRSASPSPEIEKANKNVFAARFRA